MITEPRITWLRTPLFRNAGGWDAIAGVDDRGVWYLRANGAVPAKSERGAMLLLPLMQDEYGGTLDVARARVIAALEESRLSAEHESTFPFSAPAMLAFTSMPRWRHWAVRWLTGLELSEAQAYTVFVACQDPNLEQDVRHAALRVVRLWERKHGLRFIRPEAGSLGTET